MRHWFQLCFAALMLAAFGSAEALAAAPIEGTWRTLNGTEVTISPCAQGFCGTLSWIVIPAEQAGLCRADKPAFGQLMLDFRNQNKALQSRPLLGAQILAVKPSTDPTAYSASIYNAEDGKIYDGQIWVVDNARVLRLGGGCLMGLCAVTQDWPRVPPRDNTPDFTCEGN